MKYLVEKEDKLDEEYKSYLLKDEIVKFNFLGLGWDRCVIFTNKRLLVFEKEGMTKTIDEYFFKSIQCVRLERRWSDDFISLLFSDGKMLNFEFVNNVDVESFFKKISELIV